MMTKEVIAPGIVKYSMRLEEDEEKLPIKKERVRRNIGHKYIYWLDSRKTFLVKLPEIRKGRTVWINKGSFKHLEDAVERRNLIMKELGIQNVL